MRNILATLTPLVFAAVASHAAPSPVDILAANYAAAGGPAWDAHATLTVDYDYAGQGLSGHTRSLESLHSPMFVDTSLINGASTASGYDGRHAWAMEWSGVVTRQEGGDSEQLAIDETYGDQNLWWRADRGGAEIRAAVPAGSAGFDVLIVAPRGGKPVEAWFDARTHLLARTIEVQSTQTITTFYSDYRPVDGALIAFRQVADDGTGAANRQTLTLTSARFSGPAPAAEFAPPARELHDASIAGGAASTTVPFELVNNHIFARVSVNGAAPRLFIFDTGGHDILTPPTAKALGVGVAGTSPSMGAGDSFTTSGQGKVREIRVGDAIIIDQPVSVLPFNDAAEGVTEEGMIGYEFFARFITRIDYGRRTLTFIDPAKFDPTDAGIPVPFRFYATFPEILGSYDGAPGRFGIDTGARTALTLTTGFVEANHLRAGAKGVEALVGWGVGGPSRSFVTRGGILRLGPLEIDHPLTLFNLDKGGAGAAEAFPNNVGGGVLKRYVVTLDYPHYRIWFKAIPGRIADLDTFDRSGMWINQEAQGYRIVDVTAHGPAAEAGLKNGDLIVAVDGEPVGSLSLSEVREALRTRPEASVVGFTLKDGRTVHVTLRAQI